MSSLETLQAEVAALRGERDRLREEVIRWKRVAVRCPQTGVFSRRFLDEWLERELFRTVRYERELVVALAAVDRMGNINIRHGNEAGDRVLAKVGELIERTCRRSDVVARFEGDTFALVFPETVLFSGREVGVMLCAQVGGFDWSELLGESAAPVTVSVGMVQGGTSAESLWRLAGRNLDHARGGGRNRVHAA